MSHLSATGFQSSFTKSREANMVEKDALIRQLRSEIMDLRGSAGEYDRISRDYQNLEQLYARDARSST